MKRYRVNMSAHIDAERLVADAEGAWVRHADVAELEQRLAALEAGREVVLVPFKADLLSGSFGGGNVKWWQGYLRSQLEQAYDFYQSQLYTTPQPAPVQAVPEAGRFTTIDSMCEILKEHLIEPVELTDCAVIYHVTFDQLRAIYDRGRLNAAPSPSSSGGAQG